MKKYIIALFIIILSMLTVIIFENIRSIGDVENTIASETDFITIEDKGMVVTIPIDSVPEIKNYLEQVNDKQFEISRIWGTIIKTTESQSFILLNYGCGAKMCDSVLIQKKGNEINTISLFFGIIKDIILSPDAEKVLLVYGINEGSINRNFFNVVNLSEMKIVESTSKDLANEFSKEPKWPFLEYKWVDNNNILIKIPDTSSADFSVLEEWFKKEIKKTRDIIIKF